MSTRRTAAALALLAAAGCTSNLHAFPEDFESVVLTRKGGLGFCASEGMVLEGSMTVAETVFRGTWAIHGNPPAGERCLNEPAPACVVRQSFTAIPVSPAELDELRARVKAVPEKDCANEPGLACDPCLITTIGIDDVAENDFCCGELNEGYLTAFHSLASYLDGLAAKAP